MIGNEKFSWRKRAKSFLYAFAGLKSLFRDEHNARIHLVAASVAVVAGLILHISALEWVAIVGCIAAVMAGEAFNSAIEALADRFGAEHHPLIKKAKDIAAAGVLILACGALIIGAIIFLGKLTALFGIA